MKISSEEGVPQLWSWISNTFSFSVYMLKDNAYNLLSGKNNLLSLTSNDINRFKLISLIKKMF